FKDFSRVDTEPPISISKAGAITYEAAGYRELAEFVHNRNCVACGQRDELIAPAEEERIAGNKKRSGLYLGQSRERGVDLTFSGSIQDMNWLPELLGCLSQMPCHCFSIWIIGIHEEADDGRFRNQLSQ